MIVTPEEIAQWVIDNRYPKNETEKISDLEMYIQLVSKIESICSQPNWLSVKTILAVKILWETENWNGENPRVKAVRMVQDEAMQHGIKVDLKQGREIIQNYIITP